MIFQPKSKVAPAGTGRVATSLRALRKELRRLTPTGAGVSSGPLGTSFVQRRGRGGSGTTGAASWL